MARELGPSYGQTFPYALHSLNLVNRSCNLNTGFPVCCGIFASQPRQHHSHEFDCIYTKIYWPSAYENDQFDLARFFDTIADDEVRFHTVTDYLVSVININDSVIWTERVADRMKYPLKYASSLTGDDIDMKYLSRFNVTRECVNGPKVTWTEWIEPLSIHARHPFSLYDYRCIDANTKKKVLDHPLYQDHIQGSDSIMSTDHILLSHHTSTARIFNGKVTGASHGRNYLFDAGTSTFQSSLWWFTCMYLQRDIAFDQIFGWEVTSLEPVAFWEEVPPPLRPRYHFYNAPVSADINNGNSVLKMISEVAQKSDFVAFKLDIDNSETEIPIALQLLENKEIRELVDEFFFELHFRCDVLMRCAWGTKIPQSYLGLNLTRSHALDFFQKFRWHGVRSHFWP